MSLPLWLVRGSSRIVIIFKSVHRVWWGEGGRMVTNVDYDALQFHTGG